MLRTIAGVWLSFFIVVLPVYSDAPGKLELAENWRLASSKEVPADGAAISRPDYQDGNWHPVHRMPGTVLEILQEDGVYPNLYYGKNMLENVPQDLYQHDWWYRTTFTAPAGHAAYTLEFPGINYRAEIWLNGQRIADSKQIVGMYAAHEPNVTKWMKPRPRNTLAVKVTPEQLIQDATGVELADSWFDWLNWKCLGYHGEFKTPPLFGVSFVPDRNAGVWKPVYLKMTGDVTLQHAWVNSELSLPQSTARLTVYADLHNLSAEPVSGTLEGTITRKGKPAIQLRQAVSLTPGQELSVEFSPEKYSNLIVTHPDLWWPYTIGKPNLYELHLDFLENKKNKPFFFGYYRIDYDAERKTLGWEEDTEKKAIAAKLDGGYVLKTDRRDLTADEIWRTYILLTRVETAFPSMKSPLMEHPIFHHLQRRTQTHIFPCVLAYHLLAAIEKRFLDRGIHTSWWTLRQQLSTHQVITVVLPTADGRVLKIRKGTTPELAHKEIYATLKIPTEVMKPVKTWHEVSPIVTE
jgi:hypothetical protein